MFKGGKTVYHIDRVVRETGMVLDNGLQEIYVNTKEGREQVVRLAKKVYQLHAQGKCNEDIAIECDISVEKVKEILE